MGSAVSVISVRNTVYSALFLVLAFLSSAGLWMLLQAEFLAIVLFWLCRRRDGAVFVCVDDAGCQL